MVIMKKIEFKQVKPVSEEIVGVNNPTEVRYGWMPFKDVELYNGDGTVYYYIQPKNSPYHRRIPKNQLIPFETFTYTKRVAETKEHAPGEHGYSYETVTKTAFEAATELLTGYADRGYTVLNSLQGIEQPDAERIFRIVQPFDYKIGELVGELSFAEDRIEARERLDFSALVGEEYRIEPLRNEREREIARQLASEMISGATMAQDFGLTILGTTEKDLVATASGKKEGKKSPDPLDRYLESEFPDHQLPNMYGNKADVDLQKVAEKVDYIFDREQTKEVREENERLRAEIEELKANRAGLPTPSAPTATVKCDFVKGDTPCNAYAVKGQSRCVNHRDK